MQQNHTDELGSCSVGKLLLKLAVPAIAAQIINLLYNLVDRMYIGHIADVGKLALTGVGVCLPLIMLISAFAALVSMGAAPRASIFLGKGEHENAEKTLGNSFSLLIILSITLTVVFFFFSKDLLLLFGASENTIEYAVSYMKIYSLGTIFVQLTLGLNAFISAQGFATISMMTVLIGAISNIILDPILIFGFNMGVSGAALATVISQSLSMIWILFFLTSKKSTLKLKKKNFRLSKEIIIPSIILGLSPFIMQSTESLITVCFNSSLLKYGGDIAVGAMTILTSVMQFSMLPLTGLTQGGQPIISYNYGAKNLDRVKKTFKLLLLTCLSYSTLIVVLLMLFPNFFVSIFNNKPELMEITTWSIKIYFAGMFIFGAQIACQQTFLALGRAKISLFLALLRKVVLLVPLIFILPNFTENGLFGVLLAEPVADIIACATTVISFAVFYKNTLSNMKTDESDIISAYSHNNN